MSSTSSVVKMSQEQVALKIEQLRGAIRRKFNRFRQGNIDMESELEKQYKHIVSALQKTATLEIIKGEMQTEEIKKEDVSQTEPEKSQTEPEKSQTEPEESQTEQEINFNPSVFSSPKISELSNRLESDEPTATEYMRGHFKNDLTRKYMTMMIKDTGGLHRRIDHTYGPRFEDGHRLLVGEKELDFDDEGHIIIAGTRYRPTEGLYELLFKRTPDPDSYDDDDMDAYKDILNKTNAHKRNYNFQERVNRILTMKKYTDVIVKLFPPRGQGMEISYWDDPNELCDRLRLLVASTETGNTGHGNEIINIIEELKEGGFIKGKGNTRYKSLLQ